MHLIATLAAGVNGAEDGHAELYSRGTSTRATWYSDYKGNDADSSGANITLDSNGGAVVYVDESVQVIVKNSSGTTVRDYVEMVGASVVEVKSDSFTGADYDTAASAASNPITLLALLDKWDNSSGADDWQASLDGTATNLSALLGRVAGPAVYNVQDPTYGAVGDGATDDTTAIQAAIDAAEANTYGGVVFFPPGTYYITAVLEFEGDVSLVGCGPNSTTIAMNHASNDTLHTETAASTYNYQVISGLRLAPAQSNSGNLLDWNIANCEVLIQNCHIGSSNATGTLVITTNSPAKTIFRDCTFEHGGTTSNWVNAANVNTHMVFDACRFISPASFAPTNGGIYTSNIWMSNCVFELGASTSGTWSCVKMNATTFYGSIVGCDFQDPGGGTEVITGIEMGTYAAAAEFSEWSNHFSDASTFTAYSYTSTFAAEGAEIKLGTRELRHTRDESNDATVTLDATNYGSAMVMRTGTATVTVNINGNAPEGAFFTVTLVGGGTGTVGFRQVVESGTLAVWTPDAVVTSGRSTAFTLVSATNDTVLYWLPASAPLENVAQTS